MSLAAQKWQPCFIWLRRNLRETIESNLLSSVQIRSVIGNGRRSNVHVSCLMNRNVLKLTDNWKGDWKVIGSHCVASMFPCWWLMRWWYNDSENSTRASTESIPFIVQLCPQSKYFDEIWRSDSFTHVISDSLKHRFNATIECMVFEMEWFN